MEGVASLNTAAAPVNTNKPVPDRYLVARCPAKVFDCYFLWGEIELPKREL